MPADYKRHVSKPEKKPLPGFVWLIAGLCIGLFVALLVYLDTQPKSENSFTTAVKKEFNKIKPKLEPKPKEEKPKNKSEPKFNFYTILPELEVLIPDIETRPPDSKTSTGSDEEDSDKEYILQAGSFQKKADAERLKARLALLGFEPNIQNVTINNAQWHRVRIGPYKNTNALYRNLNILHKHDINAMPMVLRQE